MSFFDDSTFFTPDNYQLCKIVRKNDEINLTKRVLLEGQLSLKPIAGLLTTKYFKIVDRKLVYFSEKNLEKPKGYYDLMTYMRISTYDFYEKESAMHIYVFRLEKFGKFHEFFLKDKKIMTKWVQILRLYCISSDFDQQYEVMEKIGSGHFAKVYKVLHRETDTIHAAKIMDKDKKFFDQKIYIFNEINILKKLPKNEYIIKLYEVYESLGELILIFEYMDGGDVYKRVKNEANKKLPEKISCFILCQVLKGLKFLHSHGVVHRDIKPENILLTDESEIPIAKLADFSLAEHFSLKDRMIVRCGTPGYMAPEMFENEAYCEKIDIFSLGISLFIMLSGKSPFHGQNGEEVMEKNKLCTIKFKKKNWEDISKEGFIIFSLFEFFSKARKLTTRMIAKFPAQRITLQQILVQKWIKENFFDNKMNELLREKIKVPKPGKHKMKEKEEKKLPMTRKISCKQKNSSPKGKEHMLPINTVNSLFLISPHSGVSFRSNGTSSVLNMTHNSLGSLNENSNMKFRSRLSSIGSGSAYTLLEESQFEEEQKDYVVIDDQISKFKSITSKHCTKQLSIESSTKSIFDDENPLNSYMKKLNSFCCQVKHSKF